MRMIINCNNYLDANDYQLQLAGPDYLDANDYHYHPPAMQLPCQVVDNDYHLQHYRFHKLAHILHMHNPCQLPMQFLHTSHANKSLDYKPHV